MSTAFARSNAPRQPPNPQQIQKLLDENGHLIQTIQDYQSKGKAQEVIQYQTQLHRNLVFLATIADNAQNVNSLLPVSIKSQSCWTCMEYLRLYYLCLLKVTKIKTINNKSKP